MSICFAPIRDGSEAITVVFKSLSICFMMLLGSFMPLSSGFELMTAV